MHSEVKMRKLLIISGLLAAWMIHPGSARAFEQVPVAPEPESGASAPAAPEEIPELTDPQITAGSPEEVQKEGWSIPGLGSMEFMPKLDFGLELMYGESSREHVDEKTPPEEGVKIRGSFKRRF